LEVVLGKGAGHVQTDAFLHLHSLLSPTPLLQLRTVVLQPQHLVVLALQLRVQSRGQVQLADSPLLHTCRLLLEPAGELLEPQLVVAADEGDLGFDLADECSELHLQLAQHLLLLLAEEHHQLAPLDGLVLALSWPRLLAMLAVL
jgi:hypothetical protein